MSQIARFKFTLSADFAAFGLDTPFYVRRSRSDALMLGVISRDVEL